MENANRAAGGCKRPVEAFLVLRSSFFVLRSSFFGAPARGNEEQRTKNQEQERYGTSTRSRLLANSNVTGTCIANSPSTSTGTSSTLVTTILRAWQEMTSGRSVWLPM